MDLWSEVKKLEGRELHTLDRERPLLILEVAADYVLVKTSENKRRSIRWAEIRNSWNHLEKHGQISRSKIMESYSGFNPAYVAAIIASVGRVKHSIKPIILRLEKQSDK